MPGDGFGGALVVTGQHDDLDAEPLKNLYGGLRVGLNGVGDGDETETGYGLSLSFVRKLFEHDVLSGQFVYGEGIANMVQGLSGQGLDAVLASDGSLETLKVASGMLAYTHHWNPRWRSVLAYSVSDVENDLDLTGGSIDRLQDAHLNLIWSPFKSFDLGAEVMWGERRNQNDAEGDATRIQFSAKYYLD